MKILELEIVDTRGIRNLMLKPDGSNFVVVGANGTGKSGVIDAVDFLLTGSISRLSGSGTAGISLARHGPHIDSTSGTARVVARVQIDGVESSVEISRSFNTPGTLECDADHRSEVERILAVAKLGQHLLTRRDLLSFVTSSAATRAEGLHELMNLTTVEETRASLVAIKNRIAGKHRDAQAQVARAEQMLTTITGLEHVSETDVLDFVNSCRATLGGQSLQDLVSVDLKVGIGPPAQAEGPAANVSLAVRAVEGLEAELSEESVDAAAAVDQALRDISRKISVNVQLETEAVRRRLTSLGLELLDDDGACPLCDTEWLPGELHVVLTTRLEEADQGAPLVRDAARHASQLRSRAARLSADISTLVEQFALLDLVMEGWNPLEWEQSLETHVGSLEDIAAYVAHPFDASAVARGLSAEGVPATLVALKEVLASTGRASGRDQEAWDVLTRLQDAIAARSDAASELQRQDAASRIAEKVLSVFLAARDAVLSQLYEAIEGRFVSLYLSLHGHEPDFQAGLEPAGAGLDFSVDFHGRGLNPPHALHSEGHQDSMGVCLFLALAERFTAGALNLVMLDDVMMSVDWTHRKALARLLADEFADRQLIITTHDRVWAEQLRTEGVVNRKNTYRFTDWSIDAGPRVLGSDSLWSQIEAAVAVDDVPRAAHLLRREAEAYFADVCDGLEAPVRYRLDSRVELGDLMAAANGELRSLVKQGKRAAQSWGDQDAMDRLMELDGRRVDAVTGTQMEQWAVNENVHYNQWSSFEAEDFRPVVEAFCDLFSLFRCPGCSRLLRLSSASSGDELVTCSCGSASWTLVEQ